MFFCKITKFYRDKNDTVIEDSLAQREENIKLKNKTKQNKTKQN